MNKENERKKACCSYPQNTLPLGVMVNMLPIGLLVKLLNEKGLGIIIEDGIITDLDLGV